MAAPFYTLSQVVSEYCIMSFNDRKKYYGNYLVHAKWVWKELFRDTLFSILNRYVKVDKSVRPYRIFYPTDAMRVYNVSVTDERGRLRSLLTDAAMDTLPMPATATSGCGCTDTLNACFSNLSVTTDTIYINGDPYTIKIWKDLCPNGDVIEITETWAYNTETDEVEAVTNKNLITNLDVKSCGCVSNTPSNVNKIVNDCGCPLVPVTSIPLVQIPYRQFGAMKIMKDERVVYLDGDIPDWVQLSYQTNGDNGEDAILVPEYAVPTMFSGIGFRTKAMSKNLVSARLMRDARYLYYYDKDELEMYLNPIRMEEFMNMQMIPAKWGAPGVCGPQVDVFANLIGGPTQIITSNTFITEVFDNKSGICYEKVLFNNKSTVTIAWATADLPIMDVFFDNGDGTYTGPVRGLPPATYNPVTHLITVDLTGNSTGYIKVLKPC